MTRHGLMIALVLAIAACPVLSADNAERDPRVVSLAPIESKTLDPEMSRALRGMVAAAIESDGGHQVVGSGLQAGWKLEVEISGRGPWKISARLDRQGAPRGDRNETGKYSFADREEMTRAVDDLAADLSGRWPDEGLSASPLAQALSSSTLAVDTYFNALTAIRSADMAAGRDGLEQTLMIDPGFALAGAEKIYLDLTEGKDEQAHDTLSSLMTPGRDHSPRSARLLRGLDLVVNNRAMAILATTQILEESGLIRWGGTLRGMARLGERASGGPPKPFPKKPEPPAETPPEPPKPEDPLDDWRQVAAIDSTDPRTSMWLGRAQMSVGALSNAANTFSKMSDIWPDLLDAYVLRAEAFVRLRKPEKARSVLTRMRQVMQDNSIPVESARTNPELMLGSVHLIEGNFDAALAVFEQSLEELTAAGASHEATATLYRTVIEMLRESAISRDPLVVRRKLDESRRMLARYEESMTTYELDAIPWEILRLRGQINVKAGDTVEAWKIATQIRSNRDRPGYSEFHAAYLEGATMLKEGDLAGSIEAFEKVVRARGSLVDRIDLGQLQLRVKRFDASRASFEQVGEALGRFAEPAAGPLPHGNELILTEPHLASLVPVYHYFRARLAYLTGHPAESRRYFDRMLTLYRDPGPRVMGMVNEARRRGAKPEGGP